MGVAPVEISPLCRLKTHPLERWVEARGQVDTAWCLLSKLRAAVCLAWRGGPGCAVSISSVGWDQRARLLVTGSVANRAASDPVRETAAFSGPNGRVEA